MNDGGFGIAQLERDRRRVMEIDKKSYTLGYADGKAAGKAEGYAEGLEEGRRETLKPSQNTACPKHSGQGDTLRGSMGIRKGPLFGKPGNGQPGR